MWFLIIFVVSESKKIFSVYTLLMLTFISLFFLMMFIRRRETHALAVDVDWFFHTNPLSLMKDGHCVNIVSRFNL